MIRNEGKRISESTPSTEDDPYNAGLIIMAGRPPSKEAPPFGQRLAALRKARGYSSAQFAKLAGISEDMLTYYERRATNPSAEFVRKAAEVLNAPLEDLHGISKKNARKSGPPSQLEQRISALRALPRERQKVVLNVIDTFLRDAQKAG
jgi:transcriptional regulator with XRE-family HTH domain